MVKTDSPRVGLERIPKCCMAVLISSQSSGMQKTPAVQSHKDSNVLNSLFYSSL